MRIFGKILLILSFFCLVFYPLSTQVIAEPLPSYTLLEDFQSDSVWSGRWQGSVWGTNGYYYYGAYYQRWYPAPAGGYALTLYSSISSGFVSAYFGVSRSFNLNKFYNPSSKIRLFLDIFASGLGRQIAAVSLRVYNNGRVVGQGSIGYRTDEAPDPPPAYPPLSPLSGPLYTRLPNNFKNFLEIPLGFATEPFNQIQIVVYNYNYPRVQWPPQPTWENNITIDHIMISEGIPQVAVETVSAYPSKLWFDRNGVGSGLVFKAIISEPASVTFKVKSVADSSFTPIGETGTIASGSENIAKFSWWGKKPDGTAIASGVCQVMAEVAASNKTATFTVNLVDTDLLGIGKWVQAKDPSAVLPPEASAISCPETQWDELRLEIEGYLSSIAVGDPVNTSSGNFVFPEIDLTLKSRFPLVLARIYNSLDPQKEGFGRGWSSPYFSRLEFVASDVVFVNSDGSRLLFSSQNGGYKAPETSDLKIALATDTGFWTVSHPNGSGWSFSADGKIIRMSRACCGMGATDGLLFDYAPNGLLIRVTNPAGQYIQFSYNSDNRIISATDSTGRALHYSYSSNGNLVEFSDVMGRTTVYEYNEDGFMTSITKPGNRTTSVTYVDRRVSVVRNPDGTSSSFAWDYANPKLSLTDLNGTVHEYAFDNNWRFNSYAVPAMGIAKSFISSGSALTGYTNALGNSSNCVYGPDGLVRSITDFMGNTTTYEWHPTFHRLTKKTDSLGRKWQYSWDSRGNLQSEIDPAGGIASFGFDNHNNRIIKIDQLGRVTRWVYENSGNRLAQTIDAEGGISSYSYDIRGNLISSSDTLNRTTLFFYDLLDRLVKTTFPDGRFSEIIYDDAGNISIRRDNLGRETRYAFDLAARLTMLTRPDGSTFHYTYNAGGQKVSETDSLGRVTRFDYSPIGLLTKTTFPDGAFETFSYDTESRLVSKTNELGQTTNLEYDQLGKLLATIDPTGARWESQYDAAGRKIADKDPLNRVTSYQLDNLDRITKVIRPDSSFTTNSFDAVGNLLSTVDALGNQWSWEFDNLNRQVKAIQPNGASSTTAFDGAGQVIAETDALNRTTRYSFDNGGRRITTTDALNNVWRNFYDNAGRLIAVQDPMGAVSSMTYDIMNRVISQSDPLGNVNSFEFDNAGRRVAKVDAMGRRSITAFDLRDRVIAETDPEGHTVSFGYNSAGQRVSLTDGANRTWRWNFDNLGRVTSEIDPLGNMNRYGFDSVGNRVSWTNARNQTTTYTFNLMNRLTQVNYPDATLATLSYDLEGRELSRSGPAGTVTKTWDSVGNMTSEAFSVGAIRESPKRWQYRFDLVGNRTSATDPEGGIFNYRYSLLNQLVNLDPPGRNDEVTLSYDAAGRLISETKPNVFTENIFDPAGHLLSTTHAKTKGQKPVLASRQYSYNQVGNRTSQTDEDGKITFYEFNRADWLTKANYPDGTQVSWSYNGAGDRLSETVGTDSPVLYSFDPAGRMISRGADSFVFDNDGNLVQSFENGIETRNTWDSSSRLTRIDRFSGAASFTEIYSFEPQNWRRLSRTADGKTYLDIYDNADETLEYELVSGRTGPALELVRQFISGPGTDDHKFSVKGRRQYGMLTDALGSVIGLTTPSGRVLAKIPYSAWGELLQAPDGTTTTTTAASLADLETYVDRLEASRSMGGTTYDPYATGRKYGPALSPHLFTMRRFEPLTKNWWHRHRFMNPKHGRFISRDPIAFKADNNLFRYGRSNPARFIDPTGLAAIYKKLELVLMRHAFSHSLSGTTVKLFEHFDFLNSLSALGAGFETTEFDVAEEFNCHTIGWEGEPGEVTMEILNVHGLPTTNDTRRLSLIFSGNTEIQTLGEAHGLFGAAIINTDGPGLYDLTTSHEVVHLLYPGTEVHHQDSQIIGGEVYYSIMHQIGVDGGANYMFFTSDQNLILDALRR